MTQYGTWLEGASPVEAGAPGALTLLNHVHFVLYFHRDAASLSAVDRIVVERSIHALSRQVLAQVPTELLDDGLPSPMFSITWMFANLTQKEDRYPEGANYMFYRMWEKDQPAYEALRSVAPVTMLLESDVVPIRDGWLQALYREAASYRTWWMKGSQFHGRYLPDHVRVHINGNALYSLDDPGFDAIVARARASWSIRMGYDNSVYRIIREDWTAFRDFGHKFVFADYVRNYHWTEYSLTDLLARAPNTYLVHGGNNTDAGPHKESRAYTSLGTVATGSSVHCDGSYGADDAATARHCLFRHLYELQVEPTDCDSRRLLVHEFWNGGFGAEVHALTVSLTLALLTNRTLVTRGRWLYCDQGSVDETCLLPRLAPACDEAVLAQRLGETAEVLFAGTVNDDGVLQGHEHLEDVGVLTISTRCTEPDPYYHRNAVPPPYAALGLFWLRSQLADFLIPEGWRTPLGAVQQDLPCVAVHARRGDKIKETGTRPDVEHYVAAARAEAERLGAATVLVASDDTSFALDILAAAEAAPPPPADDSAARPRWQQVQAVASFDATSGGFTQASLTGQRYNFTTMGLEALRTLDQLRRCDSLVATASSNFGRLLFELMAAPRAGITVAADGSLEPPSQARQLARIWRHVQQPVLPDQAAPDDTPRLWFRSLDREWHVFP
jgi:hypothetical protein